MKKIRKVLEFILALLNFLFHFKPVPDETPPISPESFPLPDYQDLEKRNEPLLGSGSGKTQKARLRKADRLFLFVC